MANTVKDIIADYRKHLKKDVSPALEQRHAHPAGMEIGEWLVTDPEHTELLLREYRELIYLAALIFATLSCLFRKYSNKRSNMRHIF